MKLRTSIVLISSVGLTAYSNANLLVNGSFEDGINNHPAGFREIDFGSPTANDITGWGLSDTGIPGSGVDWVSYYWPASDGLNSLDMSGFAAGAIFQEIKTVVGQTYRVSFDLSGNPVEQGNKAKNLEAWVMDGYSAGTEYDQVFTYDVSLHQNSFTDMKWEHEEYEFTANSPLSYIRFVSQETSGFGPALDNVDVEAVPEPAAFATLGLGVIALIRRRRIKS